MSNTSNKLEELAKLQTAANMDAKEYLKAMFSVLQIVESRKEIAAMILRYEHTKKETELETLWKAFNYHNDNICKILGV